MFHRSADPTTIKKVDIKKMVLSKKDLHGNK